MARRHRGASRLFALVLLSWAVAEVLTGGSTGLLFAAPAVLLALPLAHGHYVAEDRLLALAGRRSERRRRPVRVQSARSRPRLAVRGGSLVGRALAKRPPPRAARPLVA